MGAPAGSWLIHGGDALRIELRELWNDILERRQEGAPKIPDSAWDRLLDAWSTPATGPLPERPEPL